MKRLQLGPVVAWLALFADGRLVGYRPLRTLALVAALVLFGGCADPDGVTLTYVGSEAGFEAAKRAARQWDICGEHVEITREEGWPELTERSEMPSPYRALTYMTSGRIDFRGGPDAEAVIAHEIGHRLGHEHTSEGIMAEHGGDVVRLSDCAGGTP